MSDWLGALGGLAQIGGQLGGAYLASQANQQAAQQQAAALAQSANLQRDMYNQTRADLAPWRSAGAGALGQLVQEMGQPWGPGNPAYDFQFNEGMRALDNSGAARGMSMSGAQIRATQRFGQGLAAQGRGEQLNRLQALAGIGQTATGQGAQAAQNYGQSAGQTLASIGNAQAQGTTSAAQPWQQAGQNLWQWAMSPQWGK